MSTGPWEIIRLSAKGNNYQLKLDDPVKFTVYEIASVLQQKDGGFELVVQQACIPKLQQAVGDNYYIQRQLNPASPNSGEVNVYGKQTAKGEKDGS